MSYIVKAVTSYPEYQVEQSQVKELLFKIWPEKKESIEQFSKSTTVETRYLTLPLNYYQDLNDMGKRNVIWKAEALRLQKENIQKILDLTMIDIKDVGLIASATTTGLMVPSLEALLMNEFDFSPETKRLPLFGLGCLAGVAGLNRVHDYLLAYPQKAALLLVTELCSLTFQLDDCNLSNLIGATLFGDGAAAVLLVGSDHPFKKSAAFEIVHNQSHFYPETERLMGWDMVETGFQLVLSNEIPELVTKKVGGDIDRFLSSHHKSRSDLSYFISHPGGPKVLEALGQALECGKNKLDLSWKSLARYGNTSSVSVINVLEQTINAADIAPHSLGLMTAMGPAFCLELSLVRKC